MFKPAPIDLAFTPYTHRRRLRKNAGLFVEGRRAARSMAARVVLQTRRNFDPCPDPSYYCKKCAHGVGYCDSQGYCQPTLPPECPR
jgi:hypothetical protein